MYYVIRYYSVTNSNLLFEVDAPIPPQVGDSVTRTHYNEHTRKWEELSGKVTKVEHCYGNRSFANLKVYIE